MNDNTQRFAVSGEASQQPIMQPSKHKHKGKNIRKIAIAVAFIAIIALLGWVLPETTRKVSDADGTINGHEYVDLGLSVKWATCNVGASSPEEYGDYYAWGETEVKARYIDDNCETWGKSIDDIGGTSRDVAHVKWGGTWRMPTDDEINELLDYCTFTWTSKYWVSGYKVTSLRNGKSIFLPAAGWRNGTSLNSAGSFGFYWSSTPYEINTQRAYGLYFNSVDHYWNWAAATTGGPSGRFQNKA